MTGHDLIHLAGQLVANPNLGDAEARFRSAVSRAYYGAFHIAAEFVTECGGVLSRNASDHARVPELLYEVGETVGCPDVKEAGNLLDDLHAARNDADYDLKARKFRSLASVKQDVEMASDICRYLQQCRDGGRFDSVKAEIAKIASVRKKKS